MEALTARLIQTEQTLLDTRQQVAAVPKASALLVDTGTIGKAPKLTGNTGTGQNGHSNSQHAWDPRIPNRSHKPQLYLALALLCKRSALVTWNTGAHNGLAEWSGLSAACDSYNKGRQRVRMQHLLQLKRSESTMQMKQSTDERGKERREVRQESGRRGQDWCHTCVGTASIAKPLPLEIPHH